MRLSPALLVTLLACIWPCTSVAADDYSISSAGEMDLDTDLVTNSDTVSRYFGMYVAGLGSAMIRVEAATMGAAKTVVLRESSTRFVSYLLSDIASDLGTLDPIFKRGLRGSIAVQILSSDGTTLDAVTLNLDVRGTKRFCGRKRNGRRKRCAVPTVQALTSAQEVIFLEEFVSSIRGPIYLEP